MRYCQLNKIKAGLLLSVLALGAGCTSKAEVEARQQLTNSKCIPTYKAQTLDKSASIAMCADNTNILFAFGKNSAMHPELLFSTPKNKIQIRTYTRGMTRLGYDVLIPRGTNSWQVISERPDGVYLKGYNGQINLESVRKLIDNEKGLSILPDAQYNKLLSLKGPLILEEGW